jgi:hypothetical protein
MWRIGEGGRNEEREELGEGEWKEAEGEVERYWA